MRPIKFRAWDKRKKEWYKGRFLGVSEDGCPIVKYSGSTDDEFVDFIEVSQFTGLHDKNGKEIYEGDIVKEYSRVQPEAFYIHVIDMECWGIFAGIKNKQTIVEIIGNIYENPELLECEKK